MERPYRANYIERVKRAYPGLSISFNDFSLDSLAFILTTSLSKAFFIMFSITSQNDVGKSGDGSIIVILLNP